MTNDQKISTNAATSEGLTKREMIAAMAMQAMLTNNHVLSNRQIMLCCAHADALLEALSVPPEEKHSIYSLEDND